jgi:N-acyl-D-aspartate/D-glutamate deacylase
MELTLFKLRMGDRMLDIISKNGNVIDGTSNPRFMADVGMSGERSVTTSDNASTTIKSR